MPTSIEPVAGFLVEVEALPPSSSLSGALRKLPPGTTETGRLTDGVTSAVQAAAGDLQECLRRVAATISDVAKDSGPDDWSVEFGVAFKGGAAIPVVVSGEARANLKVTMTWHRT